MVAATLEPDNLAVRRLLPCGGVFELLLGLSEVGLDGVQSRSELHVVRLGLAFPESYREPRRFDRQLFNLCRQA